MKIEILAAPDDLEDLRQDLMSISGEDNIEEISEVRPGRLQEPVLISLVVALGGPALVKSASKIIKDWLNHLEHDRKQRHVVRIIERSLDEGRSADEVVALAEILS